jgi:cyclohexanone monooxygenase
VEVTEEGEARWVKRCIDRARNTGDFFENCTPGYYNNEGKTSDRSVQNGFYGGGSIEFFEILEDWRSEGGLEAPPRSRSRSACSPRCASATAARPAR